MDALVDFTGGIGEVINYSDLELSVANNHDKYFLQLLDAYENHALIICTLTDNVRNSSMKRKCVLVFCRVFLVGSFCIHRNISNSRVG